MKWNEQQTINKQKNIIANEQKEKNTEKQAVGGRPPRYAPVPLLPLWAPKRLAPP